MKTVFANHSEVCHIWAQREQEEGRAGNITFTGDRIDSYDWWTMAMFHGDNVCLMRSWSYSPSTSQHMSHVASAIDKEKYRVLLVPEPSLDMTKPNIYRRDHEANINHLAQGIIDYARRAYLGAVYGDQDIMFSDLEFYLEYFDMEPTELARIAYFYRVNPETMPILKRVQESAKVYAVHGVRVSKEELPVFLEAVEKTESEINYKDLERRYMKSWINGTEMSWGSRTVEFTIKWEFEGKKKYRTTTRTISLPETMLRVHVSQGMFEDEDEEKTIITSMGARVEFREGRILFDRIMAGKPVHGHRIGHYTVNSYNGGLKIGCHNISRNEITRFCRSVGWLHENETIR